MKVFITTTQELQRKEVDSADMVNLEVQIGNTAYTLSEREGTLRVSVEGQLVAMPGGANMMRLSSFK